MSTDEQTTARILDRIALFLFISTLVGLVFGYGVMVGTYRIFPYRWLAAVKQSVYPTTESGHGLESKSPRLFPVFRPHNLHPAWYDFSGARVHDANSIMPGVTLLTGFWKTLDWKPGVRLINSAGSVLHEWKADPEEIWPTSPHTDHVSGQKNNSLNYVHGCHLFDNGDIVFNIEYMGLVRMDARGEVLWKLPYRTHHSVRRDEDGDFWVCGMKWIEDTPEGMARLSQYPNLYPPVTEDYALKVSEDGEILREISILKALCDSGYHDIYARRTGDILHTNDIEPLPSAIADQYPLFSANDIAISCCLLNAVFVIDSETERVKWISTNYIQQHDPDFIGNGDILIFDNNTDGSSDGHRFGGSRIITINPETNELVVQYPKRDSQRFYTQAGGKVQRLGNGNLLITECWRGRAFEVDEAGETVWEWVAEKYSREFVPEILEGTRYDLSLEQIAAWKTE